MSIRKWASLVLAAAVLSLPFGASAEEAFTAGEYEGSAQGFGGMVNVKLTVDESAITAIEITGDGETPTLGGAAMETMAQAYVGQSDAEAVDSVSGSTITSEAVKTAKFRKPLKSPLRRALTRARAPVTTETWC